VGEEVKGVGVMKDEEIMMIKSVHYDTKFYGLF
jgi:hypothetical protein